MATSLPPADSRRTLEWPLGIVIVLVLTGLVLTGVGHWRVGTVAIGGALLVGSVERAVLPRDVVGLLRVRSRWFDVMLMGLLGAAITTVALSVPSWE